jgi:hypothetical protein
MGENNAQVAETQAESHFKDLLREIRITNQFLYKIMESINDIKFELKRRQK